MNDADRSGCREVPVVALEKEHCQDMDQTLLKIYEQHKGLPFVKV